MYKYILLISCALCMSFTFAQDVTTSYYLKNNHKTLSLESSYYYENIFLDTIINNTKIFKIEQYYSGNNSPKMFAYSTSHNHYLPRYYFEKQEYYPNGKLMSLEKFNTIGKIIDTSFYCYPNGHIELVISHNKIISSNQIKAKSQNPDSELLNFDLEPMDNIHYLAYYDSTGNNLLSNGNGIYKRTLKSKFHDFHTGDFEQGELKNNLKDGIWKGVIFGEYNFEENYENGILISGITKTPTGEEVAYTTSYITPKYHKGNKAFDKRLFNKIKSSDAFMNSNKVGTLILAFSINKEGILTNFKIIENFGYGLDETIREIYNQDPKYTPAVFKGIKINTNCIKNTLLDAREFPYK